MKKFLLFLLILFCANNVVFAQYDDNFDDGFTVRDNSFNPNRALDSLKASHKEIPRGRYQWTIDEKFGDITPAPLDTVQHLFMNSIFTTGMYGEYNTTGNLGSPRILRIATDRDLSSRLLFLEPYSFYLTKQSELAYTNTLSPITNLFYSTCGNKTNGEDHLRVFFATNVNKQLGVGFKFNYVYGKGYYQNQANSLFDYTLWASYIGERYQAHLNMSFDHMKTAENGGITDDYYITHPEAFKDSYDSDEMPTVLSSNWNKQDAFHLNLSHRYNIGFSRKVPMTEMEKEARRFAIRAQKEKEEKQLQSTINAASGADKAKKQTSAAPRQFSGRPDDSVIVGDLQKDAMQKKTSNDSIMRHLRDSIASLATAPIDTSWTKDEYVPVTSFIHTLNFDTNNRRYISNATAKDFYLNRYAVPFEENPDDSINDITKYYTLKNTFAVGLLEGFNKYVPMGMKLFLTHELNHYSLPSPDMHYQKFTETNVSVGGQLIKTLGNALHYKVLGEFTIVGEDIGNVRIDGDGDLNMRLLGDTAAVRLKAFYHLTNPNFIQRHYHGKFLSWDHEDFNKQMQTHLEAEFFLRKTRTTLRACYDNLQNYTYLGVNYNKTDKDDQKVITAYTADMRQSSGNISLLTLQLEQNFRLGILNWENRITYQKSSDETTLAVPDLNYYTNLYLNFRIAKVLRVHFGADLRYFTEYYAPEYCPQVLQYAVQQNEALRTKVGNYPVINVYANFKLKQCRFFVMMSHINAGSGNKRYFYTPHYPLNDSVFRFGLSWDFNN